MEPANFFQAYVKDRRLGRIERFARESFDHLVRYVASDAGAEGLVAFANLVPGREREQIREQVEYFRSIGQPFEWKVYELDQPRSLEAILLAESFAAGEREAFMAFQLRESTPYIAPFDGAWRVERVTSERGVRHVLSVQERVWGRTFEWLYPQLSQTLMREPDELSVYCAYAGDEPIGSGWVEYPEGSRFPELHGGAVLKAWRGRGVFAELLGIRLREAESRRYEFLCVDASPMSRPILEKAGFLHICTTVPMRKSVA